LARARACSAVGLALTSYSFSSTYFSSTFVVKQTVKHLELASARTVATLVREIFYSSVKTLALCISYTKISLEISIVFPCDLQMT